MKTLMIHGFGFDLGEAELELYPFWRAMLGDSSAQGLSWYSAPAGIKHVLRAWSNGYWNRYRYAWDLARETAGTVSKSQEIVAHSLGTRVVLQSKLKGVERVLLLNGAEKASEALATAEANPGTQFLNVVVEGDDVLRKFGSVFSPGVGYNPCIGQAPLGDMAPDNWRDIVLDDAGTQAWGRSLGWDLRGDNPGGWSDHWYSYKWPGNWKLFRTFLRGDLDVPKAAA